jgi:hypothetical protein
MNKNIIILILLVIAFIVYYCLNHIENFGDVVVSGVVTSKESSRNEVDINQQQAKTILDLKSQVNQLQADEILWEKRPIKVNDVISVLKTEFSDCGAKNLEITTKDLNFADSRINFVKFLPVTNLLNKLTYENIRCFVQKIDRNNLVSWIKEEVTMPKYLLPHNIVVVNDSLYQTSPYGVLKYKLSALTKYKGNNALNATIEASLLNDYNFYNRSSDIIFPFQGALIQKVGSDYRDLKTGDKYEIKRLLDRVDLMNSRVIKEMNLEDISSKFEDKTKQETVALTVQSESETKTESDVKIQQELQKAVEKEIFENDEVKSTLIKISQSQNLPEIKADVNKLLAKLVATKADTTITKTTPSTTTLKTQAKKTPPKRTPSRRTPSRRSPSRRTQRFTNVYEDFGVVGVIDNIPVTGKDALGIATTVIQEVLVDTGDKKSVKAEVGEVNEKKLNEDVIYVSEYNGINYLFTKNEVKPHSKWAKEVNKLLTESRTSIRTIVPHFFIEGSEFKSRIILILEDDFYVVIEDEKVQAPKDWTKEMGFSFSANLPEVYTCNENKVILEQMVRANLITDEKRKQVLSKLKC